METSNYQAQAARTMRVGLGVTVSRLDMAVMAHTLGLAGEVGEVVEHVKKGIFHDQGIDREFLAKELGDVAWYLASLCTVLGLDLGEVLEANIAKLEMRYPDGWDVEASTRKADEQPGATEGDPHA